MKLSKFFWVFILPLTFLFAEADEIQSSILQEMETVLINEDLGQILAQKSHKKKHKRKQEIVNSWRPYWLANRYFAPSSSYFFDANVGCGFLYFSNIKGNLFPNLGSNPAVFPDQLRQRLGYNRTPLFEGMVGLKVWDFFGLALSYMHQGGVDIQSKRQFGGFAIPSLFVANLSLDAILARVYFNLPSSLIWKKIAYNPYFSAAIGPGWQTWSHPYTLLQSNTFDSPRHLKMKVSANAVWLLDLGVKLQSVIPNVNFSVTLGTKFIGWGQARQIGLLSQQGGTTTLGLVHPFKVRFVYSFAPYFGVHWNY